MNRQHSKYYVLLLACTIIWCGVIIVAPLLASRYTTESSFAADGIYKYFSKICHQYDSRSFHIAGYKLAVCSRCTMIYFGFLAGLLLWGIGKKQTARHIHYWWILTIGTMVVDVILDVSTLHASTLLTRTISGAMFGVVAAFILTPLFLEACSDLRQRFSQSNESIV